MKSVWQKLHRAGAVLHLPEIPGWLLAVLSLSFILRVPSFFEPYFYGDEMIYMTLGKGIQKGLILYKQIYDNKPPLLYLSAAVAGNLFWFKVILAFWSIVTIYIFHKLAKIIFEKNEKAQKLSTFLFALLTTLPLLEGLTVNSELFMVIFTIGAFVILLKGKKTFPRVFISGVLLGLGALFKIPAAFDAPIIVFYWIITEGLGNWKEILKNTFVLALGFISPILITFIWFFFQGALSEYIKAAFLQNVGYLSSFRPGDIQKSFLERNAPLLIRGIIVLLGSTIVFVFRKRLSKKFILLSLWTLFTLFAITLSERPYPHYFIQAVAPISMFLTILFVEKSIDQVLVVFPLLLTFFVPFYYKFWIYPIAPYYNNFVKFAIGAENKTSYFNNFSKNTERNYKISDFVINSSTPNDNIFMWDPDSASVYALTNRLPPTKYVADYHINEYSSKALEVKNISSNPPKFIILTLDHPYPELRPLLKSQYLLINQVGNADIYSRIDFAPAE